MRSAFKTIYFHYSLIQYHKDIIWIIVSQNGSSDLFIIQVLTVLSKHSQRMLWLHCKSITVAFQTWKQLKCDPLQSQIPWLWSLVMLQWFAEVRLRCEQVGLTEWGFREGNRYWIYRIPWKPCHSQHILLRSWHRIIPHLRHMTQVTVQQPMQCSNFNIISKHTGSYTSTIPTGNLLGSRINSFTAFKLFVSAIAAVCKPVLSLFLAGLDHLSSRDM